MIAKHYGKIYSLEYLREKCYITRSGVSLQGISDGAEAIGIRTMGVKLNYSQLKTEAPLPCIVPWKQNHFVVVHRIVKNKVFVADPASGLVTYSTNEFIQSWNGGVSPDSQGIVLLLETGPEFYNNEDEIDRSNLSYWYSYLRPHKKLFWVLSLEASSP